MGLVTNLKHIVEKASVQFVPAAVHEYMKKHTQDFTGTDGATGMTPKYSFHYDKDTGELKVDLVGYESVVDTAPLAKEI